jgi:hypothetical protein
MLEPIPFAGYVEIDDPKVCCNQDCNQGRDCPKRIKELTNEEIFILADEIYGKYYRSKGLDFARAILRKASEK